MTILKSKFSQMILVGLFFALVSGGFSFFINDVIKDKESNLEKQIVIIDVASKNALFEGIARLRANQRIGAKVKTINEEFNQSINYSIRRYQRDPRLKGGCYKMKKELTDNTIFIETREYPTKDKDLVKKCLNNLFALSFERLKQKLDLKAVQELTNINFNVEDLNTRKQKLKHERKKIEVSHSSNENKDNNFTIRNEMCKQIENFHKDLLSEVNLILKEGALMTNDNTLNRSNNLVSIFNLFQNIFTFSGLSKECDVVDIIKIDLELENLVNLESKLMLANRVLMDANFNDVFKLETLTVITQHRENYLSKKNIIMTFTLLGFVFGVLLVYNFRISK